MNDQMDNVETIEAPQKVSTKHRLPQPDRTTGRTAAAPKPPKVPRSPVSADDEEDDGFFKTHGVKLVIGAVVLAGAGWFAFSKPAEKSAPARKASEPQMIRLVMPPPPPPPPPPKVQPPPPKDEKKVEQAPTEKPVEKPVEKPAEKPPEGLGTSIKGGEGMAGLGSGRGNGTIGGTGNGQGGGGSMGKWYAGQMGKKIAETLRSHRKTRSASMRVEAQVWVDPSGRITRATLDRSTGDPAFDEALKTEILPGIQISDPPPQGMKMPIPYRLTARRPN